MKIKTIILAGLFLIGMTIPAGAQHRNVRKQIPEGKWVLISEGVQAMKSCRHCTSGAHSNVGNSHNHDNLTVNIKNIDIEIYTEIEVKRDSIIFISSGKKLEGKYTYTSREGIQFDAPAIPFNSGGNVFGKRLYLQQQIRNFQDEAETIYISFVYEYKNTEK